MMRQKKIKNFRHKIVKVISCSVDITLTNDEAYQIVYNKQGKVAKVNRKYMNDLLTAIAKEALKKFDASPDEIDEQQQEEDDM